MIVGFRCMHGMLQKANIGRDMQLGRQIERGEDVCMYLANLP